MLAPELGKYNYGKVGRQRKVMLHSRANCQSQVNERDSGFGVARTSVFTPPQRSPVQIVFIYFCGAGAAGAAGVCAGWVFTGCDLIPWRTEVGPVRREAYTDSVIDVSRKAMADHVVARDSALAAPRGPKAVWLPCPPKAAEMSPLVPLCSSTTTMMKKHTRI